MYLYVIIDWYSRYIVDYELSSTLDKSFVLNCLDRAQGRHKTEIINSDQEGRFTNPDNCMLLERNGVRISMDGKGQCLDNARTKRFFRTLKYDRIYTEEITTPRQLRSIINSYMIHYNHRRPHSSIGDEVPANYYQIRQPLTQVSLNIKKGNYLSGQNRCLDNEGHYILREHYTAPGWIPGPVLPSRTHECAGWRCT